MTTAFSKASAEFEIDNRRFNRRAPAHCVDVLDTVVKSRWMISESRKSISLADKIPDRAMLKKHLAQAERHVLEGERHMKRQRELITNLERYGIDSEPAKQLLRWFEESQSLHIADRDCLRADLGCSGQATSWSGAFVFSPDAQAAERQVAKEHNIRDTLRSRLVAIRDEV